MTGPRFKLGLCPLSTLFATHYSGSPGESTWDLKEGGSMSYKSRNLVGKGEHGMPRSP